MTAKNQTQESQIKTDVVAKKPSKAEQMAAFSKQFSSELVRVPDMGDLEIYVKTDNYAGFRKKLEKSRALREEHGERFFEERSVALDLYDENGDLYFDVASEDDLMFIQSLPWAVRENIAKAVMRVSGSYNIPKTLSATKSA